MKIIVDGDAQPAKEEIINIATKHKVRIIIVFSVAHYTEKIRADQAETVMVDNRKQEADIKIMNLAEKGDIVITSDTALGYMCMAKKSVAVTARGKILSENDIDAKMDMLHAEKKVLRGGRKRKGKIKGPKAYTKIDKEALINSIEKIILESQEGEKI